MSIIRNFPTYSTKENIVTNNTMLLLGRVYKIDPNLFQKFLVSVLELNDMQIGPSFDQQISSGGDGIPDAMIFQPSFRIVVEAKLYESEFWDKERYTSHFNNESVRILITLSKKEMAADRLEEFNASLKDYDNLKGFQSDTNHKHLTYINLVYNLRLVVEATRTRYKVELDELLEDYESFLSELGLIDDEHLRMHVVPVGQTYELNLAQNLYYNQTRFNYSAHKYIGLYFAKEIRFVGEPKIVFIPRRGEDGVLKYTFIKGQQLFTDERRAEFERFLKEFVDEEGYGDDGGIRYHLVDKWEPTSFLKKTSGGIMGPRHCFLPDYIDKTLLTESDAARVAAQLNNKTWDVG